MTKVQTVRDVIEAQHLGVTLTHEHFALDFEHFYVRPPQQLESFFDHKINLENVGYIRHYPYSCRYNLVFNDADTYRAVEKDVEYYKKFGGGTIVENTSHGLQRDLKVLYDISVATNVNIVGGTGHYIAGVQRASTLKMSIEQLTDMYSKEILSGHVCDDTSVVIKCGFIGEVGSGWPLHEFERHAIKATGEIQEVIGCGVSFHPARNPEAPFEIVRLYLEAGGKADKCVMSHIDRTLFDDSVLMDFAEFGVYTQFDLFGSECSHYQLNPQVDMISDAQRMDKIIKLVKEGRESQVLMSHDVHTKHRLMSYGGHGFSHILNNILPRLNVRGLSLEQIDKITIENPANWLKCNI